MPNVHFAATRKVGNFLFGFPREDTAADYPRSQAGSRAKSCANAPAAWRYWPRSAAPPMSALPPKADMIGRILDVRFVPKGDVAGLSINVRFVQKRTLQKPEVDRAIRLLHRQWKECRAAP